MSQQAQNDFYKDEQEMVLDYAAAVNAEIKDLFAAGADVVQIDEPYMQARPEKARQFGLAGLECRARRRHRHDRGPYLFRLCRDHPCAAGRLFVPARVGRLASPAGVDRDRAIQSRLRRCWNKLPGKTIILGVLDLSDMAIETPETVAARIRRALPHVPAERIVVAPDCGLKYLPREVAYGKMCAMVEGAKIVRAELAK